MIQRKAIPVVGGGGGMLCWNVLLASCPWGPVTANGVVLLIEIYVIYMKMHTSRDASAQDFFHIDPENQKTSKLQSGPTSLPKMEPLGPTVLMLQTWTNLLTEI